MEKSVIVILGKDKYFCRNLIGCAKFGNIKFIDTPDRNKAFHIIENSPPRLAIITSTPQTLEEDIETISLIRRAKENLPIFFITTTSSEDIVLQAFKAGVSDYFKPPLVYKEIAESINDVLGTTLDRSSTTKSNATPSLIGKAAKMRDIKAYIEKVAPLNTTVLITGETGTGKGLAAMLIHNLSGRNQHPFVSLNCAALPDDLVESELFGYEKGAFTGAETEKMGRFEMANGGTLFLDEIGDMGPYAQAKVLKIIEEQENTRLGGKKSIKLNLRLIAATNVSSEELISSHKFRKDLYYRINVARIHIPPLRERKEDIPRLVSHSLMELNNRYRCGIQGVTDNGMQMLLNYDWPGNVRELKNILEGAYVAATSNTLTTKDFPPEINEGHAENICINERDNIISVLESTNWNKTMAASKMNCSRMTLYRKMAKYNLA